MKKIFLTTILLCAGVVGAFAQTVEIVEVENRVPLSKNGHEILPKQGDFGISVDAAPFLYYIGNMFNDTQNNPAPYFGNGNYDLTIRGMYFLQNNRSIRAALSLDIGNEIFKGTVSDDYALIQPGYNGQTVIDVEKYSFTNVDLKVGYGFHRGYRRLQASYGPQIGINYGSGKTAYTYANSIQETNQIPSSYNFGGNIIGGGRKLEQKYGNIFGVSVGAFVGVEYFIAPRLSISGEIGLGLNMENRWQGETTIEKWDTSQGKVVENSTRSLNGLTGGINLSTITNGGLFLNFYF